ncbi:MAG TPA: cryptochrome/photolyase family protein [Kiritimatiellia bacterium]|nr:cryptochrome/photolyase family protein [Kiritimatiellia bacterium]HMP33781.1 cryptochrome/photolyase family protein [Kiritimatiellia bacterium]
MSAITLIFPHQLFDPHPALDPRRPVWLVEDSLFFGADPHQPLAFHQHKLVLHRASMQAYAERLRRKGFTVHYLEHAPGQATGESLPRADAVWLADPVDYLLERRLRRWAKQHRAELRLLESPMFLTPRDWFEPWFDGRKRYFMADFYTAQRKRLGILVEPDGKPTGGAWSFDTENRKRWPAKQEPPPVYAPPAGPGLRAAIAHVAERYAHHPGRADTFWHPVTHEQALAALHHFLRHRLSGFGDFEDAITRTHPVLHHSVLTPALNTGLITPATVVRETLAHAAKHAVALNDLEGFLRQIIGWREFMRIVYVREGVRQRTANFWNHRRRLSGAWYDGTTGLAPLDTVIRRVIDRGYCHHIERLMVAGNAMLLCEIDPNEVYRWFMELFIDAYDWVMVPNVYGMSQYADGGLITTKPYLSGSNYLKKMSDVPEGPWCGTWDGLYWRFIDRHRDFFAANPRLSMMVRTLERMTPERRDLLMKQAEGFLEGRDQG